MTDSRASISDTFLARQAAEEHNDGMGRSYGRGPMGDRKTISGDLVS